MKRLVWNLMLVVGSVLAWAASGNAQEVFSSHYNMKNGVSPGSGTRHYWDRKYNGAGSTTTDAADLTGGSGDLTDNIITNLHWDAAEAVDANPGVLEPTDGLGPYVGWRREGLVPASRNVPNPLITFFFPQVHQFSKVRVHYENDQRDIFSPASINVQVGAVSQLFPIDDSLIGPRWADLDVSSLGMVGNVLELRLNHRGVWVHIDEVKFEAIPEPASAMLVGMGSLAAVVLRRRIATRN